MASQPHLPLSVSSITLCPVVCSAGPLKSRAATAIGGGQGKKTFIEYAIDYSKVTGHGPTYHPTYTYRSHAHP